MKILFIETQLGGHHISYLDSLIANHDQTIVCLPQDDANIEAEKKYIVSINRNCKLWYFSWIKEINRIIRKEQPDIVHFVYGDDLYRFWAINFPKKVKIIFTCHQIRRSFLRDMAYKKISNSVNAMVVHTEKLKTDLEKIGIDNLYHIEYPQFSNTVVNLNARKRLQIPDGIPVLLALGSTRQDKGLDILLEALKTVHQPFFLLIAGAESTFDRDFIEEHVVTYKDYVKTLLKFLDDEEFSMCLSAADIIVLPYRKSFDGASGPLGEGVNLGKMIVGANHGSLGRVIEENHLGYTFESENSEALASVLNMVLSSEWKPDSKYKKYQENLNPERFQREYNELYWSLL